MLHWLPENISTYGGKIDHVIWVIFLIIGVWFLIAEGVFLYFILRYRKREKVPAVFQPGTTWRALAWVLIPAALVLLFDLAIEAVQNPVWKEIKQTLPIPEQRVRITGRQFVWEIRHAGADGLLDSVDDIETTNDLTVPIDSKIVFDLESADVVHSLWIPHLRLKQDAVPGRTIRGWFEAVKTGDFPIACAELCGSGHGVMQGRLHVLSRPDYQEWLKTQEMNRAE